MDFSLLVNREFWVVFCLDRLINNAVNYTQRVKVERVAWHATVLDLHVLVVKVVEERRSIVSAVRLSEEVEILRGADLGIKFRDGVQQGL